MSIPINDNFRILAPKLVDDRTLKADGTPYANKAEVLSTIIPSRRALGLIVLIGTDFFYFKTGITSENQLQPLQTSGVLSVTGGLVDNTDPLNPVVVFTPSNYDLLQFGNASSNPFVRKSDLDGKVDKIAGMGLSQESFTTIEKSKLSTIELNAQENRIEKVYVDGIELPINNKSVSINTASADTELEFDVFSDVDTGAIIAGETIAQGTTFTEFVQKLLNKTFYPTFTSYSISGSAGSAVEVGTGTKTITVNFTRGNIVGDLDSGVWNPILVQGQVLGTANKYWINGIDNGTSNSATISEITTLGTNSVNIAVDYDAGAQPKDSKGDNYLTPESAGTLNGVVTWSGFYYRTAIAGNSLPTASDIRTSYTARRSNAGVINMPTGTTNIRFDVFVPQSSSLTSAIDEGNLNLNITDEFILQGSNFSGLDANGDEVLYKHYVRIVDNPYTVSSNIAITVT